MSIFLLLFLLTLLATTFSLINYNEKLDKFFAMLFSFVFIFIGTVKWRMGGDWGTYEGTYSALARDLYEDFTIFEPLFFLMLFFVVNTINTFVFFQFLQVFICSFIKYKVIKRYSKYLMLAVFLNLCFYMFDMFTVRNYVAGAICFLSVPFIEKRNIKGFVLVVLLATAMHYASLLFLLAYWLYWAKWGIGWKSVLLFVAIVLGLSNVFASSLTFLSTFFSFFLAGIGNKLNIYNQMGDSDSASSGLIMILGIIKRLFFIPIIFYYEVKYFKNDKVYKGFSNLFIFGSVIYFVVINFTIFNRLAIPFYMLEIPLYLMIYNKTKLKPLIFVLLVVYGLSKYYIFASSDLHNPIVTIFNTENEDSYWSNWGSDDPFEYLK